MTRTAMLVAITLISARRHAGGGQRDDAEAEGCGGRSGGGGCAGHSGLRPSGSGGVCRLRRGPRRALRRALSLRCHLGRFARRFSDPLLLRPLSLTFEHLREPGPVLVTGSLRVGGAPQGLCAKPRFAGRKANEPAFFVPLTPFRRPP